MNHEQAFLADIAEHPDDDAPRLVFADWLDDHGDAARAEFIRVQIELAKLDEYDDRRRELVGREQQLLAEHEERWTGGLRRHGQGVVFSRGLITGLDLREPTGELPQVLEWFKLGPVQSVRARGWGTDDGFLRWFVGQAEVGRLRSLRLLDFELTAAAAAALAAAAPLEQLVALSLRRTDLTAETLNIVLAGRFVASLRHLDLRENDLGANGIATLAKAPLGAVGQLDLGTTKLDDTAAHFLAGAAALRGLKGLDLSGNSLGPSGARALASAAWAGLASLDLNENRVGDLGAAALFASPHLANLHTLALGNAELTASAMACLAATSLPRLTRLDLGSNYLGPAGIAHLVRWQGVGPLRSLSLAGCRIGDDEAAALAGWPGLDQLTELRLQSNRVTAFGLKALLASGRLERLKLLDLSFNDLGDLGAQVLARWPGLAHVRELYLSHAGIRDEGAVELARSPHLVRLEFLWLSGNAFGEKGLAALKGLVNRGCIERHDLPAG